MNSTLSSDLGQLRGFQSFDRETVVQGLPVTGAFPEWVRGSLYRNGPARFEVGPDRFRHWFDGLGMLHRFTISDGGVSYANRFLGSNGYRDARLTGRITLSQFGTKPAIGALERLRRIGRDTDSQNANVSIVPCGDELHALTETPTALAFDALTLETIGERPYVDALGAQTITAHPHHVAAKGLSVNLATKFGARNSYHVVAMADGTRARTVIGSLGSSHPSYLHTFGLTRTHAVIAEFPLVLGSSLDLLFDRRAYIDNFSWEPQRGTRFHAMRLDDGSITQSWQGAACFAFHHINAYDDGDAIVLDMSTYDDATIVHDLDLDALRAPGRPVANASFRRYRLDREKTDATYETIADVTTELPRLNARNHQQPYDFAYGIAASPSEPEALASEIVKVATSTRGVLRWHESGHYPGEPVFVARPGASAEDDGVVLSVVLDGEAGTSYLLALDATDLREVARASLPHHVPFGFHGMFVRS